MMNQMTNQPANPQISSADVRGTRVYSPDGEKLGHIDELMIDKLSGRVAYAMMGFGGFLGIGEGLHPIPWGKLHYDVELDGYVTDITPTEIEMAPHPAEGWRRDRAWEEGYFSHFGVAPYWM